MAVDGSQLVARVGSDTSEAQADLRRFGTVVSQVAAGSQQSAQQIARLTETIGFQERQFGILQTRLRETIAAKGIFDTQTEQLRLRMDRLSSSIAQNQQRIKDLGEELPRTTLRFQALEEVATGALRRIGEIGVDSAIDGLRNLGQIALESYTTNERLQQSYESLIAAEIRQVDSTLSMANALDQANPKAQELIKWNQQLAISSPFTEQGVSDAFRMAQAYGFVSETAIQTDVDAKRLTQTLIDFTAGAGQSEEVMGRVALALGQIQARGKLSAQEINQLSEAGLNVRQILADAFDKPTTEIIKMTEQGMIPADRAISAIVSRLENDFGGAAARQSTTVGGLINSFQDLVAIGSRDIFGPAFQAAQPALQDLVDTLQSPQAKEGMQEFGQVLGDLARDGIPALIETGTELGQTLGDIYGVAQPLFGFLAENGIPVVAGLGAAYTVTLIPGIIAGTTAIIAQTAALGPLGIALAAAALSVGTVVRLWQDLENRMEAGTQQVLNQQPAWRASTEALEAYGNASEATQQKLRPYHDAIERERQIIEERTKSLADAMLAGSLSEEQQNRELAAIRGHISTLDQLNQQITKRTEAEERAIEYAETYDRLEANRLQSTQQTTEATRLSAEEIEKLQQKLDDIGQRGADAYQRLNEAAENYQQAESERQQNHQQQLIDIQDEYQDSITEADTKLYEGRVAANTDYQQRIEKAEADHHQRRVDMDYDEAQRRIQSEQKFLDDANQLIARRNEQTREYNRNREIAEREHLEKLGQMRQEEADRAIASEETLNDRLSNITGQRLAAESKANTDRFAEEQAYQQRIEAFNDKTAADYQSYLSDRANLQQRANTAAYEREIDLNDKIVDLQENLHDKILDIQTNLQQKIGDLRSRASDNQEDDRIEFDDDRDDRAASHADKIADINRRITQASSLEEQTRLQAELAAENERYAREEARAQRDFDRDQERAARDLARAEEQARQQAQRAEEQARQQAQRAEEQARQQAQRAEEQAQRELERSLQALEQKRALQEAGYAQQLQDLANQHVRELAVIDERLAAEARKLDEATQKARDEYVEREADAAAQFQREQETLELNYNQQLEALQYKYDREGEKHQAALQANEENYAERERKAQEHYDREIEQQNEALDRQRAQAQQKHEERFADLQAAYERANTEARAKLDERIAVENEKFAEQERKAAAAYERQQAQLRENLGKQLSEYAEIEAQITGITEEAALRRQGLIALSLGYDPTARVNEFTQRYNDFLGSSGLGSPSGGGGTTIYQTTYQVGTVIPSADLDEWIAERERSRNQLNGGTLNNGLP